MEQIIEELHFMNVTLIVLTVFVGLLVFAKRMH